MMLIFSVVMLGLAIASFRMLNHVNDDVLQVATLLISLTCLILSITSAPWFMQVILLVAVLSFLNRIQRKTVS